MQSSSRLISLCLFGLLLLKNVSGITAICGRAQRDDGACGTLAPTGGCEIGECCSEYGYCGTAADGYCNDQSQFSCLATEAPTTAAPTFAPSTLTPTLAPTAAPTTKAPTLVPTTSSPTSCADSYAVNDRCGPDFFFRPCPNGECCSQYGWCGSDSEHCSITSATLPLCGSTTAAPTAATAAPTLAPTTVAPTLAPTSASYSYMATESCGPKTIALTFDDGPNFATPTLLAAIQNAGIPATVFINVQNWGDLTDGASGTKCSTLKQLMAAGVEVHSHSYSHTDFSTLSNAQIKADLQSVADWLSGTCGISTPIKFFRPPYGIISQSQAQFIYQNFGYTIALWNGQTQDTDYSPPTIDTIKSSLDASMSSPASGAGSLILAHDHASASFAPTYIQYLKDKYVSQGYRFVSMSECWSTCNTFKSGFSGKFCAGGSGSNAFSSGGAWS